MSTFIIEQSTVVKNVIQCFILYTKAFKLQNVIVFWRCSFCVGLFCYFVYGLVTFCVDLLLFVWACYSLLFDSIYEMYDHILCVCTTHPSVMLAIKIWSGNVTRMFWDRFVLYYFLNCVFTKELYCTMLIENMALLQRWSLCMMLFNDNPVTNVIACMFILYHNFIGFNITYNSYIYIHTVFIDCPFFYTAWPFRNTMHFLKDSWNEPLTNVNICMMCLDKTGRSFAKWYSVKPVLTITSKLL